MKRLVVISDLHCGNINGLTPPKYQTTEKQKITWDFFTSEIEKLKPVDILLVNGDAVDGKGEKSGSREQITTSWKAQCKIAVDCINVVNAKKILLTYGTPYHVGKDEDYESFLEDMIDCKIKSHVWFDVEGVIFDAKHKVSSSVIAHGRFTSVAREKMWNLYWADIEGQPRADVFIRSHVHYFGYCGTSNYMAVTTPALQGWGSMYGERQCSGIVDIGFLSFDCENGNFKLNSHIMKVDKIKPLIIKI